MHNELLHIGPLTVYGYGFMIAMGVLAAWFVAEQRARKLKLACEHIFLSGSVVRHWWIYICEDFCSGSPTGGNFCRIQGRS